MSEIALHILAKHNKMNAEYEEDILRGLLVDASKVCINPDLFTDVQKNQINSSHRAKLVDWLIEISDEMNLGHITKHTAILIVDMLLSKILIPKQQLQLLGITAVLISVKLEENVGIRLTDAAAFCAHGYTIQEIGQMEHFVLRALTWKLVYPTPGEIARRVLLYSGVCNDYNLPHIFQLLDNFIDLCLYQWETNVHGPLVIGITSIFCVLDQLKLYEEAQVFRTQLDTLFCLETSQIFECFHVINKVCNPSAQLTDQIPALIVALTKPSQTINSTDDLRCSVHSDSTAETHASSLNVSFTGSPVQWEKMGKCFNVDTPIEAIEEEKE